MLDKLKGFAMFVGIRYWRDRKALAAERVR